MKNKIIYDLDGNIIAQEGSDNPIANRGIPCLIVDESIVKNKRIIGVDVSNKPHKLILEELPKPAKDVANEKLEQYHLDNQKSIAELTNLVGILLANMGGK